MLENSLTLLGRIYTIPLPSSEPAAMSTVNVCNIPLPCSVASIQSSSAVDISDICLLKG